MTYSDACVLGVLQGLTEFLPVSSSGHLVLAEALLGVREPGVAFEVTVHLGTLAAVLVYFRRRIIQLVRSLAGSVNPADRAIVGALLIGSIPAAVVGVLFKDFFERVFDSPVSAAAMLIATGMVLLSTRFVRKRKGKITMLNAWFIGMGQALAILPGISRSGTTIAAGMLVGVEPSRAAEFSFLLAVPAIGGATLLSLDSLMALPRDLLGQYAVGAVTAFAVAMGAVYLVLESVRRGRFEYFAYYCFAAGALGLYLFV